MKLSILIPAYNEEKTLRIVVEKILKLKLSIEREIIIIDDGSRDNTYSIAKALSEENPEVIVVKHDKNQGKGVAVKNGIKKAGGDIILIQDADLEYNPSDIPRLIKPIIDSNKEVVYGVRESVKHPQLFGRGKTPLIAHAFGNKFLSMVTSVLYGQDVADMETGYKVFKKEVVKGMNLTARSFDFEPEITAKILKKGIQIEQIDIKIKERSYGEGKKLYAYKDGPIALWTLIKFRFVSN